MLAAKKRQLEIVWREGNDPTLQTWNDLVDYCCEAGLEKLAKEQKSERGMYAASIYRKKRLKDAEEDLKKTEYEVRDWVPRDEEGDNG